MCRQQEPLFPSKIQSATKQADQCKIKCCPVLALAMNSKMLLMDEPFSALDKQTTNHLRMQVEKIWEKTHKTIILITHSVEEAVFFGDRVLFS